MIRNLLNQLMGFKKSPQLRAPDDELLGTRSGLTARSVNCLHKNNIFTHYDLREFVRHNDLRRLRGIGNVSQGDIHKYLTSKVKQLEKQMVA